MEWIQLAQNSVLLDSAGPLKARNLLTNSGLSVCFKKDLYCRVGATNK
jgi:hypothetical protein